MYVEVQIEFSSFLRDSLVPLREIKSLTKYMKLDVSFTVVSAEKRLLLRVNTEQDL